MVKCCECGQEKPQEPWVKEYRDNRKFCYICGKIGHLLLGQTDYPSNEDVFNSPFRICFDCVVEVHERGSYKKEQKIPDTNPK